MRARTGTAAPEQFTSLFGGDMQVRKSSRRNRHRSHQCLERACLEQLESRRLMSVTINGSVTLDESAGLQTSGIAVTGEDNNDSDVAVGSLPSSFSSRLFGSPSAGLGLSNAFPTQVGVGKSADNYITVSATGTLTSLGFAKADGSALPVYAGVAT